MHDVCGSWHLSLPYGSDDRPSVPPDGPRDRLDCRHLSLPGEPLGRPVSGPSTPLGRSGGRRSRSALSLPSEPLDRLGRRPSSAPDEPFGRQGYRSSSPLDEQGRMPDSLRSRALDWLGGRFAGKSSFSLLC